MSQLMAYKEGTDAVPVSQQKPLPVTNSLMVPEHDYISLTYTGADLTSVVYKLGGSGGTTVTTLTLAYTANVLQSVTRS